MGGWSICPKVTKYFVMEVDYSKIFRDQEITPGFSHLIRLLGSFST